jgi:His-Xaa-Ser system radical SAM maturase HxsC
MISLNINLTTYKGEEKPYVVKFINRKVKELDTSGVERVTLNKSVVGNQIWGSPRAEFGFSSLIEVEVGELWIIFPSDLKANRFFRPSSNSNTLMFTERCDQLCIMCSQPPKNKDYPYWHLYEEAISALPRETFLGISGGEPLLEKTKLFELIIKSITYRPDLTFHILTNAQHFIEEDIDTLTKINKNILWGIPLYSTDKDVHDQIVGKSGAFDTLLKNMNILFRTGAQIELRTVLLKQNVGYLSHIVNFIGNKLPWVSYWALMQLEPIGFARIQFEDKFYDNSRGFSAIKLALDTADIRGVEARLYNFPNCTVPKPYRAKATKSISDWKNKFEKKCDYCPEITKCSGFFEWYNDKFEYENIGKEYL